METYKKEKSIHETTESVTNKTKKPNDLVECFNVLDCAHCKQPRQPFAKRFKRFFSNLDSEDFGISTEI